jgi:hypothetical protein
MSPVAGPARPIQRLQIGCGPCAAPGWINADRRPGPGVDLCGDLRDGLPLSDACIEPNRDAASVGAKLVAQLIWYASVRTPFCFGFARELLECAGFGAVRRCACGRSASRHAGIVALDNRQRESLFVEAETPS